MGVEERPKFELNPLCNSSQLFALLSSSLPLSAAKESNFLKDRRNTCDVTTNSIVLHVLEEIIPSFSNRATEGVVGRVVPSEASKAFI
ncbi:hypothetical protein K7X08_032813 [Anisodus acutangulus]|uniref:Uncharacterized protein n=1 Tax=Anisodus acutangulus TaxID=402998 RepID=A0A9Q1RBL0_9SOLA|nr:hypothetical protein K7X08_032813 [Anisodus acutangulus]